MSTYEPKAEQIIKGITGSLVFSRAGNAVSLATKNANTVFAGPASGAAAAPTFRAVTTADMPSSVPRILAASRQNGTATGSGTLTLYTLAIPAGLLGTTGVVHYDISFRRTTGSGNVTPQVAYGGTALTGFAAVGGPNYRLQGKFWGDGATNAQRGHGFLNSGTNTANSVGTAAIDSTAAQNMTVTIVLATSSDVVTLDCVSVWFGSV